MDLTFSSGEKLFIDKDKVFQDPRAEGLEWLRRYAMEKEIRGYTDAELYAELDRIGVEKARLGRRRDQYTSHTRQHWNDRRRQVAGELRRRKLPIKRPGSRKVLGTAAHLAAQRREAAA